MSAELEGPPLTCDACGAAPATVLAVLGRTNADRSSAPGHVLRLLCGKCAASHRRVCERGTRAAAFLVVSAATRPVTFDLEAAGDGTPPATPARGASLPPDVLTCRYCRSLIRRDQDGGYYDVELANERPWGCSGRYEASPRERHEPLEAS